MSKPKRRSSSSIDTGINIGNDVNTSRGFHNVRSRCRACKQITSFNIDGICVTCWNNGIRDGRKHNRQ